MNPDLEKIIKKAQVPAHKSIIDIPIVVEEDIEQEPEDSFPEEDAIVEAKDVTGINTEEFDDEVARPYGNEGGGEYDED